MPRLLARQPDPHGVSALQKEWGGKGADSHRIRRCYLSLLISLDIHAQWPNEVDCPYEEGFVDRQDLNRTDGRESYPQISIGDDGRYTYYQSDEVDNYLC
jgi:hypothetical protein